MYLQLKYITFYANKELVTVDNVTLGNESRTYKNGGLRSSVYTVNFPRDKMSTGVILHTSFSEK
jgi:hypothetical protein